MRIKQKVNLLLSRTGDIALRRRAKYILTNLRLKSSLDVLDIGCGDGYYLYLLEKLPININLVGIDPDSQALKSAKKNLSSVKLIKGKIEKLPLKTNSFNRIIVSEVLEHLEDPRLGVTEVYRVLKPKGLAAFSVPHANYPFLWDPINWILERVLKTHIKSGFWAGFWNQHLRLYTKEQLIRDLKAGGFRKIKIIKSTHFCLPFNHYLINIVARLLASKKDSRMSQIFSKYQTEDIKSDNLFTPIFLFDKLNDYWNGQGSAVSLVAIAEK